MPPTPKKPAAQPPETTELDTSKLVKPGENSTNEPTPLGDEAERVAKEATPIADETAAATGIEVPETAEHHDAEDVSAALQRETQDGKGAEDPGESDWVSYASEGVEVEGEK
jgi:hypothetical protein